MTAPRSTQRGMVIELGRLEIDVPRSLGYFGGIGAAIAFGLIEPPLGLFIAAIPVLKLLGKANLPAPARFTAEVLDGAALPLGGDALGTVRLRDPEAEAAQDLATAESAERGERIKARRPATASASG
jgi:hypothetical protein